MTQTMQRMSDLAEDALHGLSRHTGEQATILHNIRSVVDGMEKDAAAMWSRVEFEGKLRAIDLLAEFESGMKALKKSWTHEVGSPAPSVLC